MQSKIEWMPEISQTDMPLYLAIADALAMDIAAGRLSPGDRLPPQRQLAQLLGIDFTTVARAYVEAQARGLVSATVGRGTFVAGPAAKPAAAPPVLVDFSMNLPPEPDEPELLSRMGAGLAEMSGDIVNLLRYQSFGGTPAAKQAIFPWLARLGLAPTQERLFITAGAHAALLSIFSVLAKPGETILCEEITYPGARAIAAQLGIRLVGLKMDVQGIDPAALAAACETMQPKALYLTPTLQNPTTITMPAARRQMLADIARRFTLPVIEDDAYAFIPVQAPAPLAALLPDLTWHIAGLSKCLGAGLRCAYVLAPDTRAAWAFVAAARAATVMASPLTVALVTRWLEEGTAEAILRFIRKEAASRQGIAQEILAGHELRSDPLSFSLWLTLPAPWTRSAFAGQMQGRGLGIVPSDAFAVTAAPPEAVRVGLGGPARRSEIRAGLEYMAHMLAESPALASGYL